MNQKIFNEIFKRIADDYDIIALKYEFDHPEEFYTAMLEIDIKSIAKTFVITPDGRSREEFFNTIKKDLNEQIDYYENLSKTLGMNDNTNIINFDDYRKKPEKYILRCKLCDATIGNEKEAIGNHFIENHKELLKQAEILYNSGFDTFRKDGIANKILGILNIVSIPFGLSNMVEVTNVEVTNKEEDENGI